MVAEMVKIRMSHIPPSPNNGGGGSSAQQNPPTDFMNVSTTTTTTTTMIPGMGPMPEGIEETIVDAMEDTIPIIGEIITVANAILAMLQAIHEKKNILEEIDDQILSLVHAVEQIEPTSVGDKDILFQDVLRGVKRLHDDIQKVKDMGHVKYSIRAKRYQTILTERIHFVHQSLKCFEVAQITEFRKTDENVLSCKGCRGRLSL